MGLKKSIRNNALRIALVEALIKGGDCNCAEMCSCGSYDDLSRLSQLCGIDFSTSGNKGLEHFDLTLVGSNEEDAMGVLSTLHKFQQFQQDNIFEGFLELPEGAYPAYEYFGEHKRNGFAIDKSSIKRQAIYILVSLALPDRYMNHFVDSFGDQRKTAWDLWSESLLSNNMQPPELPSSITSRIVRGKFWTKHFGPRGCFNPLAGHSLQLGIDLAKSQDETPDESSFHGIDLTAYLEGQPDEDFFCYSDHGNQAGAYGGVVVRTTGLLISHQVSLDDQINFDIFNKYLAPHLNKAPDSIFDHVIVLFSEYRQYAWILSTDPRSWDPNTPNEGKLEMPEGYGIVGSWWNQSEDKTYTPRLLKQFNSPSYTPRLRAAAQYLESCLSLFGPTIDSEKSVQEFALGEFRNMGFPKTYESRFQTELRQLLVHYDENKWIWYKVSRAPEHNGLRVRTHLTDPSKAGMFENKGNVYSFIHHQGSMSDPNDYQFITSEDVGKNRINDLVAEIEQSGKKYLTR